MNHVGGQAMIKKLIRMRGWIIDFGKRKLTFLKKNMATNDDFDV